MILHQLTSTGELEFNHISERIPWFERFVRYEERIDELQCPRLFKSHMAYSGFKSIPKGDCKYIYIVRNVGDVIVSYYHFYISHLGFKGTFGNFYQLFMKGKVRYGSWFNQVNDWASNADYDRTLFLRYETLNNNLEESIRKIADFC